MQTLPKVLLVDDDRVISSALAQALSGSYDIDVATNGVQAIYKSDTTNFDLIVLDLSLPDMSGLALCVQLRERGFASPILILSGECSVITKINLLDAGANDYLTKPVSLGELKARMRALARSSRPVTTRPEGQLVAGDLVLDRRTRRVTRKGIEIYLRRKEFTLLECLMDHSGMVVTRSMLKNVAWHDSDELWTNTVDVHIKSLRDKIDRPFGKSLIRTVHGLGYKIDTSVVLADNRITE